MYSIEVIILWSLTVVKLLTILRLFDIELWSCDPNIDMDILFNIDNHPITFEHCKPNGTCDMLKKS
jgi:hypothetical protein